MTQLKELKAFVVGWTGACGEAFVKELAARDLFKEVLLLGRRKVEFLDDDPRSKFKQEIIDFEDLSKSKELFLGCDVGYCAIGAAPFEEETKQFVKVDYDYTMSVANIAKEQGCRQFHLISSDGASKTSSFLYLKIKGKVDAEIGDLGFDQCLIYRPALILRGGRSRGIEKVYGWFIKPVTCFKPEWGQVSAEVVAKSMVNKSKCFGVEGTDKVTILSNADIHRLAKELTA